VRRTNRPNGHIILFVTKGKQLYHPTQPGSGGLFYNAAYMHPDGRAAVCLISKFGRMSAGEWAQSLDIGEISAALTAALPFVSAMPVHVTMPEKPPEAAPAAVAPATSAPSTRPAARASPPDSCSARASAKK